MIIKSIEQFRLNINSVNELHSLVESINQLVNIIDVSEILRAEIVLAISALDCFLHDLLRLGTIETYYGQRRYHHAKTERPKFDENKLIFLLTKDKASQIMELDQTFREIFSTKTFQDPQIIQKNLISINIENIWQEVARITAIPQSDIEQKLKLIVSRRNSIVHEADIDIIGGGVGQKKAISQISVKGDIEFIEKVCEAIYVIADRMR